MRIMVFDPNEELLFDYFADSIPKVGESLTLENAVYVVNSVEHFIRPHGVTDSFVSPYINIAVTRTDCRTDCLKPGECRICGLMECNEGCLTYFNSYG
jgi:hypothetical protein